VLQVFRRFDKYWLPSRPLHPIKAFICGILPNAGTANIPKFSNPENGSYKACRNFGTRLISGTRRHVYTFYSVRSTRQIVTDAENIETGHTFLDWHHQVGMYSCPDHMMIQIRHSCVRTDCSPPVLLSVDNSWFYYLKSFRPHYGPEFDSASNRNEYQEFSWG
jgi:hypothetical protein